MGVVNLVLLACVLRATTKKGRQFLEEEKCTPRENPGYAYDNVVFSVKFYTKCTVINEFVQL